MRAWHLLYFEGVGLARLLEASLALAVGGRHRQISRLAMFRGAGARGPLRHICADHRRVASAYL